MTANALENNQYGLSADEKQRIGTIMNMDLMIIDKAISSNPNCYEPIFNPSLLIGEQNYTDAVGLLQQYQTDLEMVDVQISLLSGATGESVVNNDGNVIAAQQTIDYLMKKAHKYNQENTSGRSM